LGLTSFVARSGSFLNAFLEGFPEFRIADVTGAVAYGGYVFGVHTLPLQG